MSVVKIPKAALVQRLHLFKRSIEIPNEIYSYPAISNT